MFTENRHDHAVRTRAYALAESGRFHAVREIEQALVGEGWPGAGTVLQSGYVRQAIAERLASHSH
ncbi:MAG: hypothetical protein QHC67_11195 [Sphingobium sp.]|uniref:hypothetical protein n=1 Tax=Sphingobium sp. TaxID=1912891 RepID=UPI0029AB54C2|nr:hypothetical protein [Sphingobium sp.]MDX3910373.1 hypothetical protein [Sphingobium sp.]